MPPQNQAPSLDPQQPAVSASSPQPSVSPPSQPTIAAPVPPPKKSGVRIGLIAGIVILLLTIAGSVYWFTKGGTSPVVKENASVNSAKAEKLETFTSTELGLTVSHPAGWTPRTSYSDKISYIDFNEPPGEYNNISSTMSIEVNRSKVNGTPAEQEQDFFANVQKGADYNQKNGFSGSAVSSIAREELEVNGHKTVKLTMDVPDYAATSKSGKVVEYHIYVSPTYRVTITFQASQEDASLIDNAGKIVDTLSIQQ